MILFCTVIYSPCKEAKNRTGSSKLVLRSTGTDLYSLSYGNKVALIIKLTPVHGKHLNMNAFAETDNPLGRDYLYELMELKPVNGWKLADVIKDRNTISFIKEEKEIILDYLFDSSSGYHVAAQGSVMILMNGVRDFSMTSRRYGSTIKVYILSFNGHLERKIFLDNDEEGGLVGGIDNRGQDISDGDWKKFERAKARVKPIVTIERVSDNKYILKLDGVMVLNLDLTPAEKSGLCSLDLGIPKNEFKKMKCYYLAITSAAEGWNFEYDKITTPQTIRFTVGRTAIDLFGLAAVDSRSQNVGYKTDNSLLKMILADTNLLKISVTEALIGFEKKYVRESYLIIYYPDMEKLAITKPSYSREEPEYPY